MKKLSTCAVLLCCLLGLSACLNERWSWHQKLTVTVDTPRGIVSGSATAEVSWSDVNWVSNYPNSYRGEASIVELGSGKYLFALLREDTKFLAFRTFNGNAGISRETFIAMEKVRSTKSVPPKHYPLLVTFDDITKPETVRRVDPDDLAATFGQGYALKSITLEITDEPVTQGRVERVLGWLFEYKENNFRLNGETCVACPKDRTLAAMLSGSNFTIWSN